jgi:hypothetical protein
MTCFPAITKRNEAIKQLIEDHDASIAAGKRDMTTQTMILNSIGWHENEAIVKAPYEMNRDRPDIIGKRVRINGSLYDVLGVNRHAVMSPIRQGETIGLLVEAVRVGL